MKAQDYMEFTRGSRVMVQLKGQALLATEGPDGIEISAVGMPLHEYTEQIVQQVKEQSGKELSPEELQQLLNMRPPPTSPAMAPVFIGALDVQGELLIMTYETVEVDETDRLGRVLRSHVVKVDISIDPNDVKHISRLVPERRIIT